MILTFFLLRLQAPYNPRIPAIRPYCCRKLLPSPLHNLERYTKRQCWKSGAEIPVGRCGAGDNRNVRPLTMSCELYCNYRKSWSPSSLLHEKFCHNCKNVITYFPPGSYRRFIRVFFPFYKKNVWRAVPQPGWEIEKNEKHENSTEFPMETKMEYYQ